jgi:hypothetical protein
VRDVVNINVIPIKLVEVEKIKLVTYLFIYYIFRRNIFVAHKPFLRQEIVQFVRVLHSHIRVYFEFRRFRTSPSVVRTFSY